MASSSEDALTSSQGYLCGVDPLFHDNVHIILRMLHHMEPYTKDSPVNPPFYFFRFPPLCQPRPIHLVAAAGIVVYSKRSNKYHGFMLDDGSDTVPCVSWYSNICENDHHRVELGQFVQVDGQLQWKNGKVIICVSRFTVQNDPHAELFWWMKLAHIHSRVYNQAFPIIGRIK